MQVFRQSPQSRFILHFFVKTGTIIKIVLFRGDRMEFIQVEGGDSALIDEVYSILAAAGAYMVEVFDLHHWETPYGKDAIKFYYKMGYEKVGTAPLVLCMEKAL